MTVTKASHVPVMSVCEFFRVRLKELGMPILSGSIKKLIGELKAFI